MMLVTLLVIAALFVLAVVGWGTVMLLIQLGVIVKEADRPAHIDNSNYSLEQGQEVGRAKEQR